MIPFTYLPLPLSPPIPLQSQTKEKMSGIPHTLAPRSIFGSSRALYVVCGDGVVVRDFRSTQAESGGTGRRGETKNQKLQKKTKTIIIK